MYLEIGKYFTITDGNMQERSCRVSSQDHGCWDKLQQFHQRILNFPKAYDNMQSNKLGYSGEIVMKTLIFNGSPRINGDTSSLIRKITEKMTGEYRIVDAYRCNISPCLDCRYCWENNGCAINDEMQEIYQYIQECDNILIASPLYFSELTGKLLDVGSRLQTYFCARFFRKEEPVKKTKKGAVVLVGGGDGHIDTAYRTACTLLHHMNCCQIHHAVYSHNTNERPAIEDNNALLGLTGILDFFADNE